MLKIEKILRQVLKQLKEKNLSRILIHAQCYLQLTKNDHLVGIERLYKDVSIHPIIKLSVVLEMTTITLIGIMIVRDTEDSFHDLMCSCMKIVHTNFILLMNLIIERISKNSTKNVKFLFLLSFLMYCFRFDCNS